VAKGLQSWYKKLSPTRKGMMSLKVLMIDDDEKLCQLVSNYLKGFDIELTCRHHPSEGLQQLEADDYQAVILDIMLPERDGFEVCREIRVKSDIPVIMLTARGEVTDRIVGLELGADDYLPKPFEPRELVARLQTIVRRTQKSASPSAIAEFDNLRIDYHKRIAELDQSVLELTTMEYQLLVMFSQNPGKVFDRDEIMNHLRGIDANFFSRSIDILVSRLRQKLNDNKNHFIKTVWGTGYTFVGRPK
jgi:two-component system OmpR family response regulator